MIIILNHVIISKTKLEKINNAIALEKEKGDRNLDNQKHISKYLLRRLKQTEEELQYYKASSAKLYNDDNKETLL